MKKRRMFEDFGRISVLLILFVQINRIFATNEIYDLRIHEGAEKGARITMGIALQRKIEQLKGCYGQLDTETQFIEFRSSRMAFYTAIEIPFGRSDNEIGGILHLLCPGNRMFSFDFNLHISHKNHHPPTFSKEKYHFYIPITLNTRDSVGKVEVYDNDPVIYNSERRLTLTKESELFEISSDGKIALKNAINNLIPYKSINSQILAIDYGSPQLYSLVNITFTPVTVSAPRNVHVNVATQDYQVVEWEYPQFGIAERSRITVRRGVDTVYEEELDGKEKKSLIKIPMNPAGNFSFEVSSCDMNGDTPSDTVYFHLFHEDLKCAGSCSEGGVPLCYYGQFSAVEQYSDRRGTHCLCFPGFLGISCQNTAKCDAESTIENYGGLNWYETESNRTVRVLCRSCGEEGTVAKSLGPYNTEKEAEFIERTCIWDEHFKRAAWNKPREVNKCKPQASVLTHLAMLVTFASNANSVSTIHTVSRFIRDLLNVPAFSLNTSSYAHFDQKIAENAVGIVDSIIQLDIDSLTGNTTLAKADLRSALFELSSRLPIPFSLSSAQYGIQMKSMKWMKEPDGIDTSLGTRCRVNLPKVGKDENLRAVCIANGTLFDMIDPKTPVLTLSVDTKEHISFSKFVIYLKPKDYEENYTCVHYNEQEDGWSVNGVYRIDHYYHGFVRCHTNHLGTFSLLPDSLFQSESSLFKDFTALLPIATTIVAGLAAIFLLFLAAMQRNSLDVALLFYLFFVFLLILSQFGMLLLPQVGDPFEVSPVLLLVMQYSLISLSASLFIVLYSLRDVFIQSNSEEKIEGEECCSKGCTIFWTAFIFPSSMTFATYYWADDYTNIIAKLFDRIDWLFITTYLIPVVGLFSLCLLYAITNIYSGRSDKFRYRGRSNRFPAVTAVIRTSIAAMFMILSLVASVILFLARTSSSTVAICLCISQLLYSISAFAFVLLFFRIDTSDGVDVNEASCDSLERKRDISRALLDHIDTSKHSDNGSGSRGNTPDIYLTHNLYERQPMVSIV